MSTALSERVLRLLAVAPSGLREPELRHRLTPQFSQPTVWRALRQLRSQGAVTVDGRGRATRYHASERINLATLRSRRLHESIARRVLIDPSLRRVARERLQKLREVNPHGRPYHDRWEAELDGPLILLLRTLTEPSEQADTMRQESPFTTLVTPEERRRVFESTRAT